MPQRWSIKDDNRARAADLRQTHVESENFPGRMSLRALFDRPWFESCMSTASIAEKITLFIGIESMPKTCRSSASRSI
jgi:hypothetical protein